jgi:hypothetical protein
MNRRSESSGSDAGRLSPKERLGGVAMGALDSAIGAASRLPSGPRGRRAPAEAPTSPQDADLGLAFKIAVGAIVGAVSVGVVGPIVLAIVVGLAGGH